MNISIRLFISGEAGLGSDRRPFVRSSVRGWAWQDTFRGLGAAKLIYEAMPFIQFLQ